MQEGQTRQEKIDRVLLNMALYYEHELVPDIIDVYQELLAKYSHEHIESACWEWMQSNRWFPRANEIIKIRRRLNEIMASHTGQDIEVIARDTERDNFMSAEEAVRYGLVDKVIERRVDKKEETTD